jgi:presenilin-like A22 family membrane protease
MLTKSENKRLVKLRRKFQREKFLTRKEEIEARELIEKKTPPVEKYTLFIASGFIAFGSILIICSAWYYMTSPTLLHFCLAAITGTFGLYSLFSSITKLR